GLASTLAQARRQERQRPFALRRAHLVERESMTHDVGMDVAPPAPHVGLDRKETSRALLGPERRKKFFSGVPDRIGRGAGLTDLKQSRNNRPVDRNPFERLLHGRFAAIAIALQKLVELRGQRARRRGRSLPNLEARNTD